MFLPPLHRRIAGFRKRFPVNPSTLLALICFFGCLSSSHADPTALAVAAAPGQKPEAVTAWINGKSTIVQKCDKGTGILIFRPPPSWSGSTAGVLYLSMTYLDRGYGKI